MVDIYMEEMGKSREDVIALMEKMLNEFCEKWNGHKDGWKMSAVEGKAEYMWAVENAISAADIAGHCCWLSGRFPHAGFTWNYVDAAEEVRAATGDDITPEMMYDTIQRKRLTEVVYNILCEMMIGDFPEITEAYLKFLSEPRKGGRFDGSEWNQEGCEIAGAEYCKLRGCDPETGIPTMAELKRLGLEGVIEKMKEAGLLGEEEEVKEEQISEMAR